MKALSTLRGLKYAALGRMQAINNLAKHENRQLTQVEEVEFDLLKSKAQNLNACILELERETDLRLPPIAPQDPPPDAPLGYNRWGEPYTVDGAEVLRRMKGL